MQILVSELNSPPDIPLELGFVKLSSMNLMAQDDYADSSTSLSQVKDDRDRDKHSDPHRRKSSSTSSQHRVLLIAGLGTL
jgi:hypothetical protein